MREPTESQQFAIRQVEDAGKQKQFKNENLENTETEVNCQGDFGAKKQFSSEDFPVTYLSIRLLLMHFVRDSSEIPLLPNIELL